MVYTLTHDQHFPEVPSLSMVLTKFPSPMTWDALKKKIFFTVFLHVNAISGKHRSGVLSVKMLKWLDSFDILTLPPWYFTSHAVGWVFFILFPKIFTGRWNVNFFTNGWTVVNFLTDLWKMVKFFTMQWKSLFLRIQTFVWENIQS